MLVGLQKCISVAQYSLFAIRLNNNFAISLVVIFVKFRDAF